MKVHDYINKVIGKTITKEKQLLASNLKKDLENLIRLLKDSMYPLTSIKRYI